MKAVIVEIKITPVDDDNTGRKIIDGENDRYPNANDLSELQHRFMVEKITVNKLFYCILS